MSESRKVRVVKRDGSVELFSCAKLAASMWRAMALTNGRYRDACDLAAAIEIFLERSNRRGVTAAALFEMTLKVLRRAGLPCVAETMEDFHACRAALRRRVQIVQPGGQVTMWDKSWLKEMGMRSWHVGEPVARILAGQIELEVLGSPGKYPRETLIDALNDRVLAYGLADAVPVERPATQ